MTEQNTIVQSVVTDRGETGREGDGGERGAAIEGATPMEVTVIGQVM